MQTRLQLFNCCILQKLLHLLGADIIHSLPLSGFQYSSGRTKTGTSQ